MPSIFRVDNLICQLISAPSLSGQCAWQQWAPVSAGYLTALACRAIGAGRLAAFAAGVACFFVVAVGLAIVPLHTPLVFAQALFLAPIALSAALLGLISGDLYRYLKGRFGKAGRSRD